MIEQSILRLLTAHRNGWPSPQPGAGLVAEVKLAGYPAGYVEVDVAGRTSIAWDAVRVARIEAG
jgi:hypothetical protein